MYFKEEETEYHLIKDPREKQKKILLGCIIFIPYVLIIILFALYSNIEKTKNYYNAEVISTFVKDSYFPSTSDMVATSINNDGAIQIGAGTTIFKDVDQILFETLCPSHTNLNALLSDSLLLTYTDGESGSSVLQLYQTSKLNEISLVAETTYQNDLYDVITLDVMTGLFVAISQDLTDTAVTSTIVAGRATGANNPILIGDSVRYGQGDNGEYSTDPRITSLSSNTFAISFFETSASGENVAATLYGVVNTVDLTIKLSEVVIYADNTNYGVNYDIVGLSPWSYLLVYYNATSMVDLYTNEETVQTASTSSNNTVFYGTVHVVLATILSSDGDVLGAIDLQRPVEVIGSGAAYNIRSAQVDDSSAIIAYSDVNNNFAIKCLLIRVESYASGKYPYHVFVAGQVAITQGQSLGTVSNGLSMDFDVSTFVLNDSKDIVKFMVWYSDISNGGKMTLSSGQITTSSELSKDELDYVLSDDALDSSLFYVWGAVDSIGGFDAYESGGAIQVALLDVITTSTCFSESTVTSRLSMVDILPSPLGVVQSTSASSRTTDVYLSGVIDGFKGLIPGGLYFTNAYGEIVGGNVFAGDMGYTGGAYYYEDAATNSLILSDAYIGVAISESQILLKMN